MVTDAWKSVNQTQLKRAWNKINRISTKEQMQKGKEKMKENEEENTKESRYNEGDNRDIKTKIEILKNAIHN